MGYTHYVVSKPVSQAKWNAFIVTAAALLFSLPETTPNHYGFKRGPGKEWVECGPARLVLAGPYGRGPVAIGPETLAFNGAEEVQIEGMEGHLTQSGHESFALLRGGVDTFCKTAQKPYDLAVCAVLVAAVDHFKRSISVTSDGGAQQWAAARDYYQNTVERFAPGGKQPWNT